MKKFIDKKEKLIINHINATTYNDITIIGAGYEFTSKSKEKRKIKNFESYSFHLVSSGAGYYKIKNKCHYVSKNSIFCIFPYEEIEYYPDPKNPWIYYWINFIGTKSEEILNRICISPENPIIKLNNPSVKSLFVKNVLECKENIAANDLISLSHFYQIVSKLVVKDLNTNNNKTSHYSSMAIDYINKNYTNPELNIKLVAFAIGITPAYLSRLLKKEMNTTFTTYLTNQRIKESVNLMEKGNTNIQQIAYSVGFSDPFYYSKLYKKKNNCTPKATIKQIQQRSPII